MLCRSVGQLGGASRRINPPISTVHRGKKRPRKSLRVLVTLILISLKFTQER